MELSTPTLKRKNAEEEQPRKRESWTSPSSSSVTYIRPTIASIIAALRDDAQEQDTRREPSNNVSYSTATTTATTTTITTTTTTAKETEVGRRAETVSESRSRHPEVRPRPNNKSHNGRSHAQYQTHWKEWCIRKEFSDGDWVMCEKFVSYLRELTAPQSYTDIDIPRLSIKPLFVKSRDGRDIRRASLATLEAYMKAVRSLYKEQCLVDGIIPDDSLGNPEVEMILSEYENFLSYTTLTRVGDDGDEDGEEEGNGDDGADEDGEEEGNGDDGADEDGEKEGNGDDGADEDGEEEDNGDGGADKENMDEADVSREGSPVQEESSRKETEVSSTAPSTVPSVQESRQQSENEQEASKNEKPKKKSGSKRSGRALSPVSQSLDPHYEWCIRKRYADGHRVTAEKFAAFARELTARDEYYAKDNPHLCIKPFIVNIHKGADARRASKGTVRAVLTAVRAFYMDQCSLEKVKPNVTRDLAKTAIDVIMSDYEKLLKESPGLPRIITPNGQVLPRDEERQQNENQGTAQQEAEKEDAYHREVEHQELLCEDTPQEHAQPEAVQQKGVQQEDVQQEDVQENAQVIDKSKEPSMIQLRKVMKSLWNPQTKHSSRGHSLMIAHRERLRLAFGFFEIDSRNDLATLVPPQLYHLQIRPEDENQIPTQGVAVMIDFRKPYGDSLRYSISLREEDVQVCPVGALAFFLLGKWTEKRSFPDFDNDDWMTEPIELLKDAPKAGENTRQDLYDDSADWKMWVENIMMDRPETTNRLPEKDKDVEYYKVDYPLIRHLLFVAGLRKVILQDFAAMMACETEEDGERKTGFDHAFAVRHPVLSSPAFREFAAQLREAMAVDPVVKAKVSMEVHEPVEGEVIQSLAVQETVHASLTTTKTTSMTNTTTNRPVTRKAKKDQSKSSTSYPSSSTDAVRVSVAGGSHDHQNETGSLLEAIQELRARVASLEQMKRQESELLASASTTTFPTDTISRDKYASMGIDTTMDVDVDVNTNEDIRNNSSSNTKDDADRLRRENQNLRDKVAALERANRELAEENHRRSSFSHTPEPHVLPTPAASAPRSRVVSRTNYDIFRAPNGRFGSWKNNGNISSAAAACSTPPSVIHDHSATTTMATASITSNNNHTNIIRDRNRSHSISSGSCEPSSLLQEIQDLRKQLATLEQEEQEVLDYASVAIESVEFLDNKILQIEQSMHGLWTMIARNEAAKFVAAASVEASLVESRSPAMGMASPSPLSPLHQQQQQYQDSFSRVGAGARLRIDTFPLRSRMASSVSAASAASRSGVHGKLRP
ncbi:hypothetical protein BGZ47_008972 [Haplosporangium gracile]|nr:hypothetical protein BGZ47_008972 [Haplosporangium gracile]